MSNKYCPPLSRVAIWDGIFDNEKSILKKWSNLTSHEDLLSAVKELDDKSKFRIKHSLTSLMDNLKLEKHRLERIYDQIKLYLSLGLKNNLLENFKNGGQNIKFCLRQLLTYFFNSPFKHLRGFKLKSDRNEISCYRNLYSLANKTPIEIQNELQGPNCEKAALETRAVYNEIRDKLGSAIEACAFTLKAVGVTTRT